MDGQTEGINALKKKSKEAKNGFPKVIIFVTSDARLVDPLRLLLFQTFLIPLERYLAGLMPLARTISPYRAPPKVKPFNSDDFIRSLEQSGPQLTSRTKGDWAALYRRFIKSPNFVGWYNARHAEVSTKLTLLHLECLSEARIESWMEGKAEVELVDMVLR